jgi:hypothetical protein
VTYDIYDNVAMHFKVKIVHPDGKEDVLWDSTFLGRYWNSSWNEWVEGIKAGAHYWHYTMPDHPIKLVIEEEGWAIEKTPGTGDYYKERNMVCPLKKAEFEIPLMISMVPEVKKTFAEAVAELTPVTPAYAAEAPAAPATTPETVVQPTAELAAEKPKVPWILLAGAAILAAGLFIQMRRRK